MAMRTFLEFPGRLLDMVLTKWNGNLVVVGKNQAMKMMLEKSRKEFVGYPALHIEGGAVHALRTTRCILAPEGWYCTRGAGHEGPCAARESVPRLFTTDFADIERRVLSNLSTGWSSTGRKPSQPELQYYGAETGRFDSSKENQANTPKSGWDVDSLREALKEGHTNGKTDECTTDSREETQGSAREERPAGEGSVPAPETRGA